MKFRKKPVVITARQLTDVSLLGIRRWLGGFVTDCVWDSYQKHIVIQTLEGDMKAVVGDWIIQGVKGEFYPCKTDIFEQTYERADDD